MVGKELPPEVVYSIIDLCSDSKSTLISLSLLSKFFRPYAEAYIYRELVVDTRNSVAALTAISAKPATRADFVQSLNTIVHPGTGAEHELLALLAATKSLEHLHLLFTNDWPNSDVKFATDLIRFLDVDIHRFGNFQLKSLFCNDTIDIVHVVKNQLSLKILGVFSWTQRYPITTLIPLLKTRRLVVFGLDDDSDKANPVYYWIRVLTFCANINAIWFRNRGWLGRRSPATLKLYFSNTPNKGVLRPFARIMSTVLPWVEDVVIATPETLEDEDKDTIREIVRSSFSAFPYLAEDELDAIGFDTWTENELNGKEPG
ncbi:hypothetical protein BKA70DRAFT_1562171 [Coprinopsis sp. MPI-PUGE-AT-0042]|nr:hypothetical protein BKA70DRAFT_1562171 [Coprinopsis sp. MPI-PUGE-AT-0042]